MKNITGIFFIKLKIINLRILTNSKRLLRNKLTTYLLMKITIHTIQTHRTITKLVNRKILQWKVRLFKKLGFPEKSCNLKTIIFISSKVMTTIWVIKNSKTSYAQCHVYIFSYNLMYFPNFWRKRKINHNFFNII